jgi:hypothetical protein
VPLIFELNLPLVGEAGVSALEKQLGLVLPADYRSFLLTTNGGRPDPYIFDGGDAGECILNEFYGIGNHRGLVGDMAEMASLVEGRLPAKFAQIGEDPGGNLFLLATEGSGTAGVFFFDHENEPEDADIPWSEFPNLVRIADSFTALLVLLENGES